MEKNVILSIFILISIHQIQATGSGTDISTEGKAVAEAPSLASLLKEFPDDAKTIRVLQGALRQLQMESQMNPREKGGLEWKALFAILDDCDTGLSALCLQLFHALAQPDSRTTIRIHQQLLHREPLGERDRGSYAFFPILTSLQSSLQREGNIQDGFRYTLDLTNVVRALPEEPGLFGELLDGAEDLADAVENEVASIGSTAGQVAGEFADMVGGNKEEISTDVRKAIKDHPMASVAAGLTSVAVAGLATRELVKGRLRGDGCDLL